MAALEPLIEKLEEASKVPAKRRAVGIRPTVDDLTSSLYEAGSLPDDLVRLVNLIVKPNHLDQATKGAIVRNLYPASRVPIEALLALLGCLGHGKLKPSLAIQALLLRWLIMVYHVLGDVRLLSQAYAVLFSLVDTAALRPQLCHLLALITRRKHVRPFRIQAILTLSRQAGSDAALTGLLRVYKNYYPEIIVGETTAGRAATFKHPDPAWRSRLEDIQTDYLRKAREEPGGDQNAFRVNHGLYKQTRGQTGASIPRVHTLHAQEDSITLEEIDSPESLARNLDKIELPSQLVAVLSDPALQKLMTLRGDSEAYSRVNNWVTSCIRDVATGDGDVESLLNIVEVLIDYVSFTQTLPPTVSPLLRELFKVWDGVDRRDAVLSVLSYAPLVKFDELYESTLGPLEACILDNTSDSQIALLGFYVQLLRRWKIILLSTEDPSTLECSSVSDLVSHVNNLTLTLSQTRPIVSTHLIILEFYDCAASLSAKPSLLSHLRIEIPPATLVYVLNFSHCVAILSRLCGIVATYKRGLEASMARTAGRGLSDDESERVRTFNGILMDICNCVWRAKAFGKADANSQGCRVAGGVVAVLQEYLGRVAPGAPLASAFGVSYSPALCLQSLLCLRELEDGVLAERDGDLQERHGGPVTQKSLAALKAKGGLDLSWQEYRLEALQHLERSGFGGIPVLMYNTMKILMHARPQDR